MVKLIKMVRDQSHGKPFSADVHPDELANYKRVGFVELDESVIVEEELVNEETKAEKTEEETNAEILALHVEGKNSREIAEAVGTSWQKVAQVIKRNT